MSIVYIGLGSNVAPRADHLTDALYELFDELADVSSIYRSEPIDCIDTYSFLNCVAKLETSRSPVGLLKHLQSIEDKLGRTRPYPNAPRTIDIDVLLYEEPVTVQMPNLQIPHPRMHERLFVLEPLFEIDSQLLHPTIDLAQAYASLEGKQRVEKYISKKDILANLHFV
jgi:2-amino-4-hydroxy-6-hydroxymethyldihydropteridine diphosphokinase